ncbi:MULTISPECIES: OmpA family protein [Vibrio]|uniref:OmpA family protein n=1 Tax=Vibrio TaxID=662 RepID=UPI001CC02083|nr:MULTISPECIES: OmpA family protein [Vibrio]
MCEPDSTCLNAINHEILSSSEGVTIVSHTDQVGSLSYNEQPAERRAQTVVAYLKTKLDPSQFVWEVKAFGELQPVINEESPEANALNRRAFIVFKESELGQPTE